MFFSGHSGRTRDFRVLVTFWPHFVPSFPCVLSPFIHLWTSGAWGVLGLGQQGYLQRFPPHPPRHPISAWVRPARSLWVPNSTQGKKQWADRKCSTPGTAEMHRRILPCIHECFSDQFIIYLHFQNNKRVKHMLLLLFFWTLTRKSHRFVPNDLVSQQHGCQEILDIGKIPRYRTESLTTLYK
jgi:hypothetical protein